ncbi:hypothetical protein CHS0354_042583 [Potamilus streckersoni]|uniref:Uncharacterized protein n=1 Tax=Potamilus streckersoni TaxID=2493646 RepID=A0AAE0TDW4_9BIVA|nr:hypothetical protein CHS0354_042583 [Potamilus streckersoni]
MSVQLTLRLRNGEKKLLSEPVGHTDGEVDLVDLHQAISKVQEKANNLLTVCVEEQKSAGLQNNRGAVEGNEDDNDEDEESENEPEEKKPKK